MSNFKLSRKYNYNFRNCVVFADKVKKRSKIKKWRSFSKPLVTKNELIRVSNYFAIDHMQKIKTKFQFDRSYNKKLLSNKSLNKLEVLLVDARFFKNLVQARFFLRRKYIFVNKRSVTKGYFQVKPGDVISLESSFFKKWGTVLKETSFFSKKDTTNVFVQVPSYIEVSYSTGTFVFF